MLNYLQPTEFLDFMHPAFQEFVAEIPTNLDQTSTAVALYYLVRDSFLYDPYHLDIRHEALKASNVLSKKRAWCVEKATLLAACCRKFGIPSRLGYAVVSNHIGVDKLCSYLGRSEIVFHGFVDVFLDGNWIKCTPAFDRRICAISKVSSLEWNGKEDSLFQAFEGDQKFMTYHHFYGTFEDVPILLMNQEMKSYYPHLFEKEFNSKEFSFFHL